MTTSQALELLRRHCPLITAFLTNRELAIAALSAAVALNDPDLLEVEKAAIRIAGVTRR